MTDGERWAQTELDALRACGFRPTAWSRFLLASWQRAAETRRARPALARQARTWSAVGLAAGLAARSGAARLHLPAPTRRAWVVWWLGTATMLDWHLGMLEGPAGEPREHLSAADALTLTRLGLVPFVAVADGKALFTTLVAGAGITDLLDGRVARHSGSSRLGRDLDTTADVALKLAAAHAARRAGWLTPTTALALSGCQVAGVAAVAATYFATGRAPADSPSVVSRAAAPALMSGLALAPHAPHAANSLVASASVATIAAALTDNRGR